ncbi:MAG: c-type cytochrome [Chromatiales bacterium]|nr:c-type cytochrome [Chromatiales bacterium]
MKRNTVIGLLMALLISASFASFGEKMIKPLSEHKPVLSDTFKTLLANADVAKGEMTFMRKCSSCHDQQQEGGHGKGPHLWNLFGRKAGSAMDFEYSDAMRSSGHTWDLATLNYYLTRTDAAVPGRSMNFRGIRRDKVRANLLAFLMQFNDNPPALP